MAGCLLLKGVVVVEGVAVKRRVHNVNLDFRHITKVKAAPRKLTVVDLK
jgi:hypothetical protein